MRLDEQASRPEPRHVQEAGAGVEVDARALVPELESWSARLGVPRLSAFGIAESDIPAIVADSRGRYGLLDALIGFPS